MSSVVRQEEIKTYVDILIAGSVFVVIDVDHSTFIHRLRLFGFHQTNDSILIARVRFAIPELNVMETLSHITK